MFIGIEFREQDGQRYFEQLNVTHITRLSFTNIRNPEAGTNIHLRTGEILKTPIPLDVLSVTIDDCWKEAASIVLMSIINEKLQLHTSKEPVDASLDDLGPLSEKSDQ